MSRSILIALLLFVLTSAAASVAAATGAALFQQHCASCHGADRLGLSGPALLPGNLQRLQKPQAGAAIANGLPASQMPAFGQTLSTQQIDTLVNYIYTPPAQAPAWGAEQIRASRRILSPELLEPGAVYLMGF